jgi:hypothetical protein
MRRRITILVTALMLALMMSFGGAGAAFAQPNCAQVPNNPNCVVVGPGESENAPGQGTANNPNIGTEFQPGAAGGR